MLPAESKRKSYLNMRFFLKKKYFFNEDYRLIQQLLPTLAIIGSIGHLLFFEFLTVFTPYWESLPLRTGVSLLLFSIIFLPRKRPFNRFHVWYFEGVLVLALPVFFLVFLFKNDVNLYWSISVMFAAIPYGLLAHPPKAMILYPASVAGGMLLLGYQMGNLPNFAVGLQIHVPAYFIVFILGAIQTVIKEAYAIAEKERCHAEELLHNILPASIVSRLKSNPAIIADKFKSSTILFADIVGFTPFSERVSPERLITVLNEIFSFFDQLTDKYGLEKIKTIGDAYMVASGIPVPRDDHAEAIANMALEMQNGLERFNLNSGYSFKIRIGIHSGPVAAGVIGIRKFSYDVWGDTVNTASRMESAGIPGKIQLTEASYDILKKTFKFEHRGAVEIKGKGLMETYLLERRREIDS